MPQFDQLTTPLLLLDEGIVKRNAAQMANKAKQLGVSLRAHMKTAKSVDVLNVLQEYDAAHSITVSTLKEAEYFFAAGINDIIYAVGITPNKLSRVVELRQKGCQLKVILDSKAQAEAVNQASFRSGESIPALIEIDIDGCRSGLQPTNPKIAEIGEMLNSGSGRLAGVITHAGGSYSEYGEEALTKFSNKEKSAIVAASKILTKAGLPCPIVSLGSTPTSIGAKDLTGVTEMRAGVFIFNDLSMAAIDACTVEDIAISVLTTVIGHQADKGWTLVDAGWTALSSDQGTGLKEGSRGYGAVCDSDGNVIPDLYVSSLSQEHGIIKSSDDGVDVLSKFPVGTQFRILPNHACAMATQFDEYTVIKQNSTETTNWPRIRGW